MKCGSSPVTSDDNVQPDAVHAMADFLKSRESHVQLGSHTAASDPDTTRPETGLRALPLPALIWS